MMLEANASFSSMPVFDLLSFLKNEVMLLKSQVGAGSLVGTRKFLIDIRLSNNLNIALM